MMDTILEIPMDAVVEGLALDLASKTFLLEHKGSIRPIFELIFAVESGMWNAVVEWCSRLAVEEEYAAECYSSAMAWAQSIIASL